MEALLVSLAAAAIVWLELPGLVRAGRRRDLVAFVIIAALAGGLGVAVSLGFQIDGLHRGIMALFGPPLAWLKSILAP